MAEGELDATIADGLAWVCGGELGGFLAAERTPDALHIYQLAVSLDRQGRGIGSALLAEAHRAARRYDLPSVTLTTFRDVAWNELFYAGLGYRTLGDRDIGSRLRRRLAAEVRSGMPRGRRCAMRLAL